MYVSDCRIVINRRPGLRLELIRWKEDAELLVLLPGGKGSSICAFVFTCHLVPVQLNLCEPVNCNQNVACSEQKEGQDELYRTAKVYGKKVKGYTIPIPADSMHHTDMRFSWAYGLSDF